MKRIQLVIFTLFVLIGFSCDKKETNEVTDIYGKWKVAEFISVESLYYDKNNGNSPLIEFRNDGTYILKLDVNLCIGNFTISDDNSISVAFSGCTKVCCDSEFSKKFIMMLPKVKSFHFSENRLNLDVPEWGWIELVSDN